MTRDLESQCVELAHPGDRSTTHRACLLRRPCQLSTLNCPRARTVRRSVLRAVWPVLFSFSVLASTGAAQAQATPPEAVVSGLALEWEAPDACAGRDRTLERVGRLLGVDPKQIVPAVHARARVRASDEPGGKLRLLLVLHGPTGERSRELEAPSCTELSDAAALILALAIHPDLDTSQPELAPPLADPAVLSLTGGSDEERYKPAPPAPPAPPTPPTPVNPPPASVAASSAAPVHAGPARAAAVPWHLALELGPTGTLGIVPSPAFGIGGGVALASGRLRVGLTGTMAPQRRVLAAERPTAGGDLRVFSGAARVCYLVAGRPRVEFSGCWVFEGGLISGDGFGVEQPSPVSEPWVWGGIGALARIEATRPLGLVLEADGMVAPRRLDFRVSGFEVQRSSAVGGIFRVLLEVRIF